MSRKNLIIGGVPRSGKTTLCKRLANDARLTHVSLDALVHAFEKAFPTIGISNDATDYNDLCALIKPFLFEHLHSLSNFGIPFVLDGYYVRPQDLVELQTKEGFQAVFIGYPCADPHERLQLLRSTEHDSDWTKLFSDEVLISKIEGFIRASARLKEWCESAGVMFIDVSHDWDERLEALFQRFMAKM